MSAVQSSDTLQYISVHAIDRFVERVSPRREVARIELLRMYRASRPATMGQLNMLHVKVDPEACYRFSDTGLGLYLLVIKNGALLTIWSVER